ncbi:YeeE/YedE family protein [Pseudomonas thivervalensis]|uniref:YeeE/YedE family protein n=1 Tax=Pseudomonas thivervalensis TaxID=86265 RepID=UPI003CF1F2CF
MPARPSTGGHTDTEQEKFMNIDWLNFTPWSSLAGGLLIGLAAGLFVVANGRIAGVSGLIGSLLQRGAEGIGEKALFLLGLLVAPLLWAVFTHLPALEFQRGAAGLIIAGLLVGIGTRYGSGCTSGHGVCGLSRLSPRSMVATACFMFSGFATVLVLRQWLGV